MKRAVIFLIVINLIGIIIMTEDYIFEKNNGQNFGQNQQSFYPASEDFKRAVEQSVDGFLKDKIFNLIRKKLTHWFLVFDSKEGYTTSGTVTVDGTQVLLTTAATLNAIAEINKQPAWQGLITFSQYSFFRTAISFGSIAAQQIYITVGNKDSTNYYGFKVVDANLYGVSYDGTTEKTILLQAITATNYNLEAVYSPSDKVIFLVNSVEKGVISVNLPIPSATPNVQLMDIELKTTEAVAKTIQVSFWEYLQFRNILQ